MSRSTLITQHYNFKPISSKLSCIFFKLSCIPMNRRRISWCRMIHMRYTHRFIPSIPRLMSRISYHKTQSFESNTPCLSSALSTLLSWVWKSVVSTSIMTASVSIFKLKPAMRKNQQISIKFNRGDYRLVPSKMKQKRKQWKIKFLEIKWRETRPPKRKKHGATDTVRLGLY